MNPMNPMNKFADSLLRKLLTLPCPRVFFTSLATSHRRPSPPVSPSRSGPPEGGLGPGVPQSGSGAPQSGLFAVVVVIVLLLLVHGELLFLGP